jgi:hypothetical protein
VFIIHVLRHSRSDMFMIVGKIKHSDCLSKQKIVRFRGSLNEFTNRQNKIE